MFYPSSKALVYHFFQEFEETRHADRPNLITIRFGNKRAKVISPLLRKIIRVNHIIINVQERSFHEF